MSGVDGMSELGEKPALPPKKKRCAKRLSFALLRPSIHQAARAAWSRTAAWPRSRAAARARRAPGPRDAARRSRPRSAPGALRGVRCVLHCAGLFARTSRPMVDACLAARAYYLDITGEIPVFEALSERDREGTKRGHRGAAGRRLRRGAERLPGRSPEAAPPERRRAHARSRAERRLSHGTASTALLHAENGALCAAAASSNASSSACCSAASTSAEARATRVAIAWGDVASAWFSTRIPNIEVYLALGKLPPLSRTWLPLVQSLLTKPSVQDLVQSALDRASPGPSADARRRGSVTVFGEARDASGRRVRARIVTPDGYTLTAHAALHIAQKVLASEVPPRLHTLRPPSVPISPSSSTAWSARTSSSRSASKSASKSSSSSSSQGAVESSIVQVSLPATKACRQFRMSLNRSRSAPREATNTSAGSTPVARSPEVLSSLVRLGPLERFELRGDLAQLSLELGDGPLERLLDGSRIGVWPRRSPPNASRSPSGARSPGPVGARGLFTSVRRAFSCSCWNGRDRDAGRGARRLKEAQAPARTRAPSPPFRVEAPSIPRQSGAQRAGVELYPPPRRSGAPAGSLGTEQALRLERSIEPARYVLCAASRTLRGRQSSAKSARTSPRPTSRCFDKIGAMRARDAESVSSACAEARLLRRRPRFP